MATIYLKKRPLQSFWSIVNIEDVAEEGRGLLSLEVQEYLIISGDIAIDPTEKLQQYLDDWKKHGYKLVFVEQEDK